MSFVHTMRQHWREYVGPKDERIEAETNRIYKVGFIMLAFGWLVYIHYKILLNQVAVVEGIEATSVGFVTINIPDFFEWGWLILTCVVLAIKQTRRGFVESNRFGETEIFPAGYFALLSTLAGAGVLVGVTLLRVLANIQVVGVATGDAWLVGFLLGSFESVAVFLLCWLTFYCTFRTAKKRRAKTLVELEE